MKFSPIIRFLATPILLSTSIAIALVVPQAKAHFESLGSYPSVVCPGPLASASETIELPTSNLPIRFIGSKNTSTTLEKKVVVAGVLSPSYIGGNPGSEIAEQSVGGSSTAATVCEVGSPNQWFIGGSAGVTSQSLLEIINSGLSDSTVAVNPYNSKVALAPITMTVKANSQVKIPLASIVPGDESVAINVVTVSGRVTAFLLDHRKDGLHDLGSSFVTPVDGAQTTSYIAGLTNKAGKASSMMRFLDPGNVDANVHLTIYSTDGVFTPVGFDSFHVAHQKVVDAALPTIPISGAYGIEISSDQPIVASELTRTTGSDADFAWANQLTPISKFSINLGATSAAFVFMGDSINLEAKWRIASGKSGSQRITGSSYASWHAPGPLESVTFTPETKLPIYGGVLVAGSGGGFSYLPLLANQKVIGASPPVPDIRTLTRP